MKRLVVVLAVAVCGLLAVAGAAVAYLRWSAGLVENALETARQAEAAGDDGVAAEEYQKYVNYVGPKADPAVLADRSLLLLRLASLPEASPKDVGRAFDATEVAIRQRPDDMRLRRRLGELKLATGDFNQAREHLLVVRDAIKRGAADDDLAAIDVQIARTWNGTGDHRQALEIVAAQTGFDVKARSFPAAASKNPPRADAYLLLAEIVRDKLGDKPAAESVIERCMQAHPGDPAVLVPYADLMLSRNEPAAEKGLVKARALVPAESKSRIDELLARCHAMLGEWDEAIEDYQRLDRNPLAWGRAMGGMAQARLDLGQRDAAAEIVRRLERRWLAGPKPGEPPNVGLWLHPQVLTMIRAIRSQPADKRDWSGLDALVQAIASSSDASDWRLAHLRAELLAAKGEVDAALAALPADDPAKPLIQLDPLRLSLVGERDGIAAMREALAALPRWRRDRSEVLVAVARAEARHATGDDRGWLESMAAATDRLAAPEDAVQALQSLAGLANAAGWYDEARGLWSRAATRLPNDFRPPLARALDAARAGDADAGAKAAAEVVALEGKDSPRGRVDGTAKVSAAQRKQLDEARKLLVEARSERKRWQPVEALSADIELIAGKVGTAVGHLQRARAYGPEDAGLTRLLADTLNRFGRRTDADQLRETIAPAGLSGGDRLVIDSLLASNDFPAAANRSLAVIDVETADVATRVWLGRLCERAGMQERAGEFFTRVTQTDPSNPDAWIWLARWQVSQEAKEAAQETIVAGLRAVPEDQRRLLAARGAAVIGRLADAERLFREAAEQAGSDIAPAASTVDFLVEQKRGKEAEAFLQEIIDSVGGDRREVKSWATQRLADLRDVSWK